MIPLPPRSTLTDTRVPYTTLFRSPGPGEPLVKTDCPLNSSSGCSPSGRRPRALTSALLQRPTRRPLQILQLPDCPRDTLPGRLSLTIVLLGHRSGADRRFPGRARPVLAEYDRGCKIGRANV